MARAQCRLGIEGQGLVSLFAPTPAPACCTCRASSSPVPVLPTENLGMGQHLSCAGPGR